MLAITSGEPAGIGPDICLDIAGTHYAEKCVLIGCPELFAERAKLMSKTFDWQEWQAESKEQLRPGSVWVLPVSTEEAVEPGVLNVKNANYVVKTLDTAIQGCLDQRFTAMVTAPVQKSIISDAGLQFSGHTEYLAEACERDKVVMMLANGDLRVALVTTHLPLRDVSDACSYDNIEQTLRIVHHDLVNHFGIDNPRISVCGLNPHAGESGHMGREEIEVIQPCIKALRSEGLNLSDALPADTAFTRKALVGVDAVVAMYHDQGLPVVKAQGFGEVVNVTLGLPIVRTSVDHGTALDLAASGRGSSTSLFSAIDCALNIRQKENVDV